MVDRFELVFNFSSMVTMIFPLDSEGVNGELVLSFSFIKQ